MYIKIFSISCLCNSLYFFRGGGQRWAGFFIGGGWGLIPCFYCHNLGGAIQCYVYTQIQHTRREHIYHNGSFQVNSSLLGLWPHLLPDLTLKQITSEATHKLLDTIATSRVRVALPQAAAAGREDGRSEEGEKPVAVTYVRRRVSLS